MTSRKTPPRTRSGLTIPKHMMDSKALYQRGWSKYLIRAHLSTPDMLDESTKPFYHADRVIKAESKPDVQKEIEHNLKTRAGNVRAQAGIFKPQRPKASDEEIEEKRLRHELNNPRPDEPMLTHAELMERGWSRSLIREALEKPDYVPWTGFDGYLLQRVEIMESFVWVSKRIQETLEQKRIQKAIEESAGASEPSRIRAKNEAMGRVARPHARTIRHTESPEKQVETSQPRRTPTSPKETPNPLYDEMTRKRPEGGGPLWNQRAGRKKQD